MFFNSHDGSGAIKVAITPIRVVCQNTLNLALSTAKRSWSMIHTGDIKGKMQEAKDTLFMAEKYMDKVSEEIEEIDNEAMRQGREFEDYVARRFTEATGRKVRRANAMFYHEKYPFMLADIDRMVVGENAGLECKTGISYSVQQQRCHGMPVSDWLQRADRLELP